MKFVSKTIALVLILALFMGLAGCTAKNTTAPEATTAAAASTTTEKTTETMSKDITLKFFSNVPDRTGGLGLLEETNVSNYMSEHPELKLETEQLQDEPYKMKLQTYMQSGNMPDMWMQWGSPAMLSPVVEGGFAAELNPDDYKDYGFVPGALEAFTVDGKLYGLPKNADFWVLFYNQKILEENNIAVPETTDDLIAASQVLNAKGIIPIALPGKDQWPTAITLHNLIIRCIDKPNDFRDAVKAGTSAQNSEFVNGADELMRLIDNDVFQASFNADDYGTAKNLFIQGKAAMYLMGSWEMGMASDESIDEAIRTNIRAAKFPTVNGYSGNIDNLVMWYGGGYAVSANSENKDAAIEMLNYMLLPENYAKQAWQMKLVIPPMKYDQYLTGEENQLQLDLTQIMTDAVATTGDTFVDTFNPTFKADSQSLTVELASKMVTAEEFFTRLDEYANENK